MSACAAVVRTYGRGESAPAQLVGQSAVHCAVTAAHEVDGCENSVVLRASCDDVHHSSEGVAAVDHRCRSTHNLHALRHHRLVVVRHGVSVQAGILRQSVDEHEHVGVRCTAYAAHLDASAASGADAVAHHASLGDEQSGHLIHQCGQDIRLLPFAEDGVANHTDGHRQQPRVGLAARAGGYDLVESNHTQAVLRGCGEDRKEQQRQIQMTHES